MASCVLDVLFLCLVVLGVYADSTTSGPSASSCVLVPTDKEVKKTVASLREKGTKLIEYDLVFKGYPANPLTFKDLYQSDRWHRVFTHHGRVLLSLAFNYDMLSLSLLKIGVEYLNVELQDDPPGCLGTLEEIDALHTVMWVLLQDFQETEDLGKEDYVCHQGLELTKKGYGHFVDRCCRKRNNVTSCEKVSSPPTIDVLYIMLIIIKIGFLFFGPLYLMEWVFSDTSKLWSYIVPMSDELKVKLTPKQLNRFSDPKTEPLDEGDKVVDCRFKNLHILVDHSKLMTEKSVPIGFFRFIFHNIFLCKIADTEPFKSCCGQSIFGSWSNRFLCLPLFSSETDCNRQWKKICSWRHIFQFIGGCGIFLLISLPFIIRVIIFYHYEDPEIMHRKQILEANQMKSKIDHNVFHHLTPTHSFLIVAYSFYCLSFLVLAILMKLYPLQLRHLLMPALADLRNVSYLEAVRMVMAHLLLPFEKFGMAGFVVSLLYLPITLCLCVVALVCYCVPTLYLTGRMFLHHRPPFFKTSVREDTSDAMTEPCTIVAHHSLSLGARCIDEALLLENISHDTPTSLGVKQQKAFHKEKASPRDKVRLKCPKLLTFLMGLVILVNMYALLGMYAEVFGFIAEVIVLTLMGAIINASTAHKYVMLFFWAIMYSTTCYNKVYKAYFTVNRKLFSFIKGKLNSHVMVYMMQPEDELDEVAFKFFTRTEVQELDKQRRLRQMISRAMDTDVDDVLEEEVVTDKDGRLMWRTCSLVLFVDQNHVPRIPKKLFYQVSQQEVLGCPGPVYKSMARATRHFINMLVFLLFVFIIILTFGSIYNISSTNQLILTAVGGFIPDIINRVMTPNVNIETDLNTYTFDQKISQILCHYKELWPVADFKYVQQQDADLNSGKLKET